MEIVEIDIANLALVVAALSIGSFAKGVTGIGLPIVVIPLLAAFIGVEAAVVILVLPSLASNLWLIWIHRRAAPSFRRLGVFLALGLVGAVGGTWLLALSSERLLSLLLALWLGIYLVLLARKVPFRLPEHPALAPAFGLAAGALQGATGISAPIIAPYLTGIGLVKESFVFAITLAFTVFAFAQLVATVHYGLLTPTRLAESAAALAPVALFLPLGIRVGRRLSRRGFERALFLLLIVMDLRLLYDGLWGIQPNGL